MFRMPPVKEVLNDTGQDYLDMEALTCIAPIKDNLENLAIPVSSSSVPVVPPISLTSVSTDIMGPSGGGTVCPPPLPPKLRYLSFISFFFKF